MEANEFTVSNSQGLHDSQHFDARLIELWVPDRYGDQNNVGFWFLYLDATIGRVAGGRFASGGLDL